MLGMSIGSDQKPLKRILCLGAHCDDIEIGCGGLLLRLGDQYPDSEVKACIFSGNSVREAETRAALAALLSDFTITDVAVERFRNGYFPSAVEDIKDYFETLKVFEPDLILTHYRKDLHQDHRIVSELTANTFRNHLVLEYEILKYDGDMGNPNFYVPLETAQVDRKIETLMQHFPSQQAKPWFAVEAFESLMRIRGIHGATHTGYAEGYYVWKSIFVT